MRILAKPKLNLLLASNNLKKTLALPIVIEETTLETKSIIVKIGARTIVLETKTLLKILSINACLPSLRLLY